ncbi:MAG: DUF4013 domain-containing protein [Chloroflexi bacterium]|nr:DUF4013 domain-containing protein [Chloroflexota bacterium]
MFRDRHGIIKLGEAAVFALLVSVPVMGLICLCALLGYLAEIIHNVSNDYPRPLPEWDHIGEDISKGFPVLAALVVYHLPLLLALAFLYAFRGVIAVNLFGGITFAGIVTGLAPLLLLYLAFAWSLFAIALARYAETWESEYFYQFNSMLRTLQTNSALAIQWLIASLAASIVLLLLLPVLLLGAFLFIPVQGFILGRYAFQLRRARRAYAGTAENEPYALALAYPQPEAHAPLRSGESV